MTTLERFVRERQPHWDTLDRIADRAKGRPERLGPDGVRELAAEYRSASADLALARRRFPHDPATARLERLVARTWHLVYDVEPRREGVGAFLSRGYWTRIAERPGLLVAAAALLFVPAALGFAWALADAPSALAFVPAEYRSVTEPRGAGTSIPLEIRAAFSGAIFVNNIRVSFLAFAGGILLCAGTAYVLLFNGLFLGTLAGLATGAGNGRPFIELVTAHGVLELSCIVVTAAAGLRIGWAIADPGDLPRGRVLVTEARRAVEVVLGTIPFFIAAGLIEGFLTPARAGLPAVLATGAVTGAAYWTAVATRSEPRSDLRAQVRGDARLTEASGRRLDDIGTGRAQARDHA